MFKSAQNCTTSPNMSFEGFDNSCLTFACVSFFQRFPTILPATEGAPAPVNVQYLLNQASALFEIEQYTSCVKVHPVSQPLFDGPPRMKADCAV